MVLIFSQFCAICEMNLIRHWIGIRSHLLVVGVDYKNGHDHSCPMSISQRAYLSFYFAAALPKSACQEATPVLRNHQMN